MRRRIVFLVALVCYAAIQQSVSAQNHTWSNTSGGDWHTAGNWSGGGVPDGSDDTATIGVAGTYTITLGQSASIDDLIFNNANATLNVSAGAFSVGDDFTIEGVLNMTNSLDHGVHLQGNKALTNNNTINVEGSGSRWPLDQP